MKTKTSEKRSHEDLIPHSETPEPKRAKKTEKTSLMQLPADLLQSQIIPRLQGYQDGSAMSFALTNKKAHSQTTQTLASHLLGDIRAALKADAFAPGANARNVRPHEPHPASKAFAALLRLENLLITRGIMTTMEASHLQRSVGSVASALETVAEAVFAVVEGKTAGHKPVPFDAVSAFLDIKAHMHQPIDAWMQKEFEKVATGHFEHHWDAPREMREIQKVAEHVRRGNLDALQGEYFGGTYRALPPIWLYGSSMERLRIEFSENAEIPKELSHLTGLQILHVHGSMNEARIDALVNCCKSLNALMINDLSTHHLPVSLATLPNLTRLGVSGTNLSQMAALTLMPNLRIFAADECPALNFPNEVLELTNLEHLGFAGCAITSVPDGIARLSRLQSLELGSYSLFELPLSIKRLNLLEVLHIGATEVDVPMFAAEMPHLKAVIWGGEDKVLMAHSPERIGHLVKYPLGYIAADGSVHDELELLGELYDHFPHI